MRNVSILGGVLSLIIPFFVFFKTMAPTLSFWDTGEFIACANILGVPHPPGTPFLVVIGRFAIELGLFKNVAMRTNFLSPLASACTALVSYLIVLRVCQRLPFASVGSPLLGRIGIRIGALSSSLLMSFAGTFWFNAVETEAYAPAMLLMMLIIYLAIKWADEKEQGGSDKLIVFITYLLFLSIGIHLTVFMIVPALFIFFVMVDKTKLRDPMFWATWLILFSVVVPFYFIVGMIIPWVDDKSYWIWVVLMIVGLVFSGIMTFGKRSAASRFPSVNFRLAFALFAVGIIGYSNHVYIPIRASQHPSINENDPSSFGRFESYIERKQYGQESMISRMIYRRGTLAHQFGRYQNMGFGGYFVDQYTNDAAFGLLKVLVFGLGIFGLGASAYYGLRKAKSHPMILLFMVFLISSLGLILYLNFSDGTRPDPNNPGELIQLEVRERDYFYTPAFVVFATIIGIGMGALMSFIGDGLDLRKVPRGNLIRYVAFAIVGLGFLVLPLNPATANYQSHDRSKDYAPEDYAYNILQSCKPNGIIFTNGDNDTFPLWYLQEVERTRRDVRVVNLSLLNTDWYILQLKRHMGVKISLNDDQIEWIPAARRGAIIYYRPKERYYDQVRKKWRYMTAEQDPKTGQVTRVQDQMIEQIVIANMDVPVYFSGSVPNSNRWTLQDRLLRQGIVLQVDPNITKPGLDIPETDSLVTKVYMYRGLNDLYAYKDENNVGLTTTFPERFSELSDAYKAGGDTTRALQILWKAGDVLPYYHQIYMDLEDTYKQLGDSVMVDSAMNVGIKNLGAAAEAWSEIILYQQFLGVLYFQNGMLDKALYRYQKAYELQPDNSIAFRLLRDLALHMGKTAEARQLMFDWSQRHPEDLEARNYLNRFR